MSENNFILNSLLTFLNEDHKDNSEYIFTLPVDIENSNVFDTIQNIMDDLENTINVSNISNENNFVEFHIEFELIDNDLDIKYFKNCNEINNTLCKSTKIKKNDTILSENCFICMENYNCSELKRELPFCKHYFHKKCIDKWLKQKASCPICRDELIK